MIILNEQHTQEYIHQAVLDSLSWLDELPSQETEILARTRKEDNPLITVCNGNNKTIIEPYTPVSSRIRAFRFSPVLAVCAVIVLIAGLWTIRQTGINNRPLDNVTQPLSSAVTPGTPDSGSLPAAVSVPDENESSQSTLRRE